MSKTRYEIETRAPLGDKQKELMLSIIIRRADAFRSARDRLLPEHFSGEYDKGYRLIWATVLDFYEEHEKLPTGDELFADVSARLEEAPDYADYDDVDVIDEFLEKAFTTKRSKLDPRTAAKYLAMFLSENLNRDLQRSIEGDVVVDLPSLLESKAAEARGIEAGEGGALLEPLPTKSPLSKVLQLEKTETGISFINTFLGGGTAAGEVYGFVAPINVGKTVMACQLMVERAKIEQARWLRAKRGYDPPRIYGAFWEEPIQSVLVRLVSCFAQVDRALLEQPDDSNLSTWRKPGSYKDYEREIFSGLFAAGGRVPGERERVNHARAVINRFIRVVDFVGGNRGLRKHATQMARGLASVIEADQLAHNNPGVLLVVGDHANAAAQRKIDEEGLNPDRAKRHLLSGMPLALKSEIAAPMKCPVWIMHQLDTKSNQRAVGVVPKASDTAEAKNFTEYCDFAFLVGTKTLDGLCVLADGKARRVERQRELIVHVNGKLCRFESTDNRYRLDRNRIVPRDEYAKYADDDDNNEISEDHGMSSMFDRRRHRDTGV